MNTRQTISTISLAAVLATMPVLIAVAAHAQTPAPAPAAQTPGSVKVAPPPEAVDVDAAPAGKSPAPSAAPPTVSSKSANMSGSQPGTSTVKDVSVGAAVFGSDGKKIGEIKGFKADSDGMIEEIHVKTGGILGFGGKVVVVPGGKISKAGQTVQIAMTSDEIGKLPAMADKKS